MSDTKDDILEAATKLFLQRSYDAVSIKDITEAVGVTKGALYHHFSSKEELFSEVIGREFHAYQIDFGRLPNRMLKMPPAFRSSIALSENFILGTFVV